MLLVHQLDVIPALQNFQICSEKTAILHLAEEGVAIQCACAYVLKYKLLYAGVNLEAGLPVKQ